MSRRGQTASYELAAAPPPAPAARASPAPSVRGAAPKKAARRMEEEPEMMRAMSVPMASYGGGGPPGSPPPPPEPEPSVEEDPSEGWLDFDRLRMAGPGAAGRGRLFVPHDASRDALEGSADAIEVVAPGATVLDPRAARGHYDYRWDASARSTVPSDGLVHRVRLGSYAAKPRYRFWTIPREVAEVFREAFVDNPTPGPLLGGPVDVYVEGSLLTTAPAAHVDRGGVLRVGLGVEERLKVARNVRVEEDAAGLLGGSTEVDHHVSIELVSSLGQPATIEVYDRVPVSDEKGLEIKRVAEDPKSEVYKQEDRGRPIRGGLCWKIPLAPGGARTVKLHYRLAFSSKQEIVGGNRRD